MKERKPIVMWILPSSEIASTKKNEKLYEKLDGDEAIITMKEFMTTSWQFHKRHPDTDIVKLREALAKALDEFSESYETERSKIVKTIKEYGI